MRNLRTQLLLSHLMLAGLMLLVMIGGIVNFFRLGRSIDRILKDNYKSVIAAQEMKEALERQDSAATFVLAGQTQKARDQYQANRTRFLDAYHTEASNITEQGEKQIADDIARQYAVYRQNLELLLYPTSPLAAEQSRAFYFGTLEPAFRRLKQRSQDVLDLNQAAIIRADDRAKSEARRASYTAVGVTTGAFLLALILVGGTVRAALLPLHSLARQAEEIGAGHLNQKIELHRSDEIGTLAEAFNAMAVKLQAARLAEEERLHLAERMSDAALESLYDPVIVTDNTGHIVHLNPAAEGLFGSAAQAKSRPVAEVVDSRVISEAIARAIHDAKVSASEDAAHFVTRETGEKEHIYRLRASPMNDGNTLLGAVAVLEDITHLHELDRLKTEFIGVASHELRTPVTSLLLSVQLLEEGAVGELSAAQKEVIAAQREDLERLERMMHDLLDMTRLEAGTMTPQQSSVTPAALIAAARDAVEAQAEAKGVTLNQQVAPNLPPVRADKNQIVRVLLNLLNNAVRHTPAGGAITVRALQADDRVQFEVEDTGDGIPPDYLPKIFERFVQVPGATGGGAGLGLSIAQTILNAHGGAITAESEAGKGAKFVFALPAA